MLRLEQLEARELLTVAVPDVSGTEGLKLGGQIATFSSTDVQGTSPTAKIAWGDGITTDGSIIMNAGNDAVNGTHTYAIPGTYPITVTITGTNQSTAIGQGKATINPVAPVSTATTVTPTAGQPFTGVVASFIDPYPGLDAASYGATIAWGDDHTSIGTIASNGAGGFDVSGTNAYAAPGQDTITVIITRLIDGQTATATSKAVVVAPSLTAVGTAIVATASQPFTGTVATFTDATPQTVPGNYQATIAWGDGHTSIGSITSSGSGGFNVSGTNTYAAPGSQTVTVTITRLIDNQTATATSKAVIVAPALTAVSTTIVATAGQPFTGVVATFSDATPQAGPGNYQASIAWGDGQSSAGNVTANGQGVFNVTGTHVYGAPNANESIVVTIVRLSDGQTATANSTGIAVNSSYTLTGHLDPLSDTGVSNSDGITAINQPTFVGTAMPYAIVQLFVRRSDQAQPVLLGQAIANTNGAWHLAVGALPDGAYSVTVAQIPPTGFPTTMASAGRVVIDTKSPRVKSATVDRGSGQVVMVFGDDLSGMNQATLANLANYAIVGHRGPRMRPSVVTLVPISSVVPSHMVAVRLRFNVSARDLPGRTVDLGGITDLAGNPLGHGPVRLTPVGHGGPDARHAFRLAARARHGMHRG